MEVKINREIRNYTESIFFGLSLRQFFFSVLGCITAVILYFSFHNKINNEILSWICIIGVVPFAALGFITYNGMPIEKFLLAWIKSEILVPRNLKFVSENSYYEIMKPYLKNKEKEDL